ncbi:hypothetical protein [Lentilitoribacter sp. Alg239-R112]|uniref:hypothetical protein n=1 Tax=Lentilitoribacter sp. Alg239-R112 TaxID=2305987 RepID=UPI0013A6DA1C|nr:hypothetical protein [Lentilitoribacter sp. Alg239-R112]
MSKNNEIANDLFRLSDIHAILTTKFDDSGILRRNFALRTELLPHDRVVQTFSVVMMMMR